MPTKKKIFIYPITNAFYDEGGNSYIRNLISHLGKHYRVVNSRTTIGLLDVLLKIHKCDIIYFNWVEDIPVRRFGVLQIPLLVILLGLAKILNIKIVWFVHNNISHSKKYIFLKRFITQVMKSCADVILTHSKELKLNSTRQKIHSVDHPLEDYQPVISAEPYKYDILIWGTVAPYKGILEFIEYVAISPGLKKFKILIAGKFNSISYYNDIKNKQLTNVTIINKILSEDELTGIFAKCRYVLFTYNSSSVLGSASLSKSLSFGKEVIGPKIGSFKELGSIGLLYNYDTFASLEILLNEIASGKIKTINKSCLVDYINRNTWDRFATFLFNTINASFKN